MTTELIIIVALILYISFLHYQLFRKSHFIESLLKNKSALEQALTSEGVEELIKKIQSIPTTAPVKKSKIFEDPSLQFITESKNSRLIFIHYTKGETIAKQICKEGFRFSDSFHKTAEQITGDLLDLTYKHNLRKNFGDYMVVIEISKDVYDSFVSYISQLSLIINVEQVLSQKLPELNDDMDDIYLFPKEFVKGYVNVYTGTIVKNNKFDPNFKPSLET